MGTEIRSGVYGGCVCQSSEVDPMPAELRAGVCMDLPTGLEGRARQAGCLRGCVSASVIAGLLLVKQPVPISTARTPLPGARVLLIVHSVHTSGRQDPGGWKLIMCQRSPSLFPEQHLQVLPTSSPWPGHQSEDSKGSLGGSDPDRG